MSQPSLMNALARQMISRVEVDTAYGPPIKLDDPFAPGPPNPYLQQLRPRVRLHLRDQSLKPITIQPYGAPGPTKWPMIQAALVVGGFVLAGGVLYRLLK